MEASIRDGRRIQLLPGCSEHLVNDGWLGNGWHMPTAVAGCNLLHLLHWPEHLALYSDTVHSSMQNWYKEMISNQTRKLG